MDFNVMSGMGCARDLEMRGAWRNNARAYLSNPGRERRWLPLGLSDTFRHIHFVVGDLVSTNEGKIVPLDPDLPFAGILEFVGEDRGKYIASVTVRGVIIARVDGLSSETRPGQRVYAVPAPKTQTFTLEEAGTLVGEVLAIESLERSTAIIGIRLQEDNRPFELSGPRPN